mgnify:CR=1 FL=1
MKYKVLGKYINGIEITGYGLIGEDGNTLKVKLSDFQEMVKNNLVEGFKHISTETKDYVIPRDGLESKIEVLNTKQFKIKDRVVDKDGHLIGYKVTDSDNAELTLSKGKVWELAFEGTLEDVRASYIEENDILKKVLIVNI